MFGFSLSYREAAHLRELCREGPVQVYARVDTTLYDGAVENVTSYIPGTGGDEEVLMLAHIYEQGANDNASGAGLSLEVFRTLGVEAARQAVIRECAFPQFVRFRPAPQDMKDQQAAGEQQSGTGEEGLGGRDRRLRGEVPDCQRGRCQQRRCRPADPQRVIAQAITWAHLNSCRP